MKQNKLHIALLAVMAIVMAACTMRPSEVISNRRMVNILVDMHYAEGVLQSAGYNYGHDADLNAYYANILEKHGVTQAQFDSSIVWYTIHPQYFQRVYPKVEKRLEALVDAETERQAALDAELRAQLKAESDSAAMAMERTYFSAEEIEHVFRYGYSTTLYEKPIEPLCTDSLWGKFE